VSFKKWKSQDKGVEVTVNSKEENSFDWILSKNSASQSSEGKVSLKNNSIYKSHVFCTRRQSKFFLSYGKLLLRYEA
jgi:hypothetical protein